MVKLQQPCSSDAGSGDHRRSPSKTPTYEFSVPFELGSWRRRRRRPPSPPPPPPPPPSNRTKIIIRIPCRRPDPIPPPPSSSDSSSDNEDEDEDTSAPPPPSPPALEDRPILDRRKRTTAPDVAAAAAKRTTSPVAPPRSLRPREGELKKKRPDLYISLSKTEIDEDFIAITGRRPPRYPERRPKAVQRMIHTRFPGSLLPRNITADRYTTDTS